MDSIRFSSVDEYFAMLPPEKRKLAETMRKTIRQSAPEAEELISYNMPSYKQQGMLVYFAVSKNHIGFYPTPSGIEAFKEELSMHHSAKGSVRFPLDQRLPVELVADIVKFRVKENQEKRERKKGRG